MIGHQCPSKDSGVGFDKDGAKAVDEILPIQVISKDSLTFNTSADDMVQSARGIYAGLAWHAGKGATSQCFSNIQLPADPIRAPLPKP